MCVRAGVGCQRRGHGSLFRILQARGAIPNETGPTLSHTPSRTPAALISQAMRSAPLPTAPTGAFLPRPCRGFTLTGSADCPLLDLRSWVGRRKGGPSGQVPV